MTGVPIRAVIGLPPDDTVRAFEVRDGLRATVDWSEMWHHDHARAFTVAKVANLDLLGEIQASLADVLANGGTFEQWQANLVPHLQATGWWGEVADRALTGTDDVVHVGPRRLRTIYDTNLRVSRAAGRWQRIQELKAERPFLRYTAVLDTRTRPEHRRWHAVILPVDHPWWDTHFPPCGWQCRCTVRQLSQRDLDRRGWHVSPVPDDGPPRRFSRADGQLVDVPAGISPGFAYNPGRASMQAIAEKAIRSLEAAAAHDLPAARAALDDIVASDAFPAFLEEPVGKFPVAVLDPVLTETLRAPSPVIVLPKGVLAKQRMNHAELGLADYRLLPTIIHDPLVIVDQGDARVVFYAGADDRHVYKAVTRADVGERNAVVVSFHLARPREIAAEARKGTILLDRRGSDEG